MTLNNICKHGMYVEWCGLCKNEKRLECLMSLCKRPQLRHGLCGPCCGYWYAGRIVHPEYGVYNPRSSQAISAKEG